MKSNSLRAIYRALVIAIGLAIIIVLNYFNRKNNNARSTRKTCASFFALTGITLEKVGEFDTDAKLIVLNHQSLLDIIYLEAYHPNNICWIAKKELGEIPFYGHALTDTEMILIDRDDKKGLVSLLKACKEKLNQNRPLVIFPEGTRGKGQEKFLPFKQGAKIIAEKFQLKIQPMVLINSIKVFNSKPLEAYKTRTKLVMLESYTPDFNAPTWYEELEKRMQTEYLKHYHELNA
ncbi:1-acyl-sn-glycerol-3-phosphate acyltransferase [Helicobacter cetorum]|uniref:1-acyl-sn-glycerol-3-phosphate acyltransferase n=1 Tax=Helicobacter cetorum (strain ATCC BAA-540 / CCUG 52418 / MIT 99-5656) TaxID=1163745 RepID=I0ESE6_HELCM|nr:1-acyl-sn-glycerol-3-phosphate acyltransferase [Helicobacter cetorum]AFI05865.1 1-acyl-sn-glycerol-3-phosphate acyltransferase [Helicobacter cetorum MIT 99-5656]